MVSQLGDRRTGTGSERKWAYCQNSDCPLSKTHTHTLAHPVYPPLRTFRQPPSTELKVLNESVIINSYFGCFVSDRNSGQTASHV